MPPQIHLLLFSVAIFADVALSATFTVVNGCDYTVWPGVLSGAGSPALQPTGFALSKGESRSLPVPSGWSGRLWARTLCSSGPTGKFSCATADCSSSSLLCSGAGASPPATLAEFTLSSGPTALDFYDVSLVDGYNLPVLVAPQRATCAATGCLADLNPTCPTDLRVVVAGSGRGVACRSACEAFRSAEYCCSGAYGSPNTCKPTEYSQFFKNACPRAYSYAYDDATSTFTCAGGTDYVITFCPSPTTSQKSGQSHNPQAATVPLVNDTMVFLSGDEVSSSVIAVSPIAVGTTTVIAFFSLLLAGAGGGCRE